MSAIPLQPLPFSSKCHQSKSSAVKETNIRNVFVRGRELRELWKGEPGPWRHCEWSGAQSIPQTWGIPGLWIDSSRHIPTSALAFSEWTFCCLEHKDPEVCYKHRIGISLRQIQRSGLVLAKADECMASWDWRNAQQLRARTALSLRVWFLLSTQDHLQPPVTPAPATTLSLASMALYAHMPTHPHII